MQVKQISVPLKSLIYQELVANDYSDSYAVQVSTVQSLNPETCAQSFFASFPNWVIVLIKIRDILVIPFKINKEGYNYKYAQFDFKKGDKVSFFEIIEKSPDELLLYVNDCHLEAWLSILTLEDYCFTEVIATTSVKFHNKTGTVYFFFIKPFHKIIIKSVLKRIAIKISNN